ncbi:MAG: L,D-transpeptidase [Rhizomicrobium sp.]
MSPLRRLSTIYLLGAAAFSVAILFDRHPALEQASRQTVALGLDVTRNTVVDPGVAAMHRAGEAVVAAIWGDETPAVPPRNVATVAKPSRHAAVTVPPPTAAKPTVAATPAPAAAPGASAVAILPGHEAKLVKVTPRQHLEPALSLVPPPAASASVAPAELVRISMRLKDNLTHEMLDNFSLFLYVSKADNGPWAQHMYVFRKDASGNLAMLYNWPASTGREKVEIAANGTRQPSYTPQGYYQLDPDRMYKKHFSGQWHEPMPHAMFFNWENHGYQTGLAIHGAVGLEVTQLGSRASAGCIRIAPENAALLFGLIRAQYKGLAPRFAFDRRTATMSNDGLFMHDPQGNLQLAQGYKVLVFVENYGGENVVAALF